MLYQGEADDQMGEGIPFDVNVIDNREDYNFYICVKKM